MATLLQFPANRRSDGTAGDAAHAAEAATAEIVSLRAARSVDPAREFAEAYHAAAIAEAERDLIEAKWLAAHYLSPVGSYCPEWELRSPAFDKMVATTERVAALPAMNASQLQMKKAAIGRVWLKAKGERYDAYRKSIAADEARLAKKGRP